MIELLIVISMSALLIGILIPALSSARGVSRGVKCASNLRQWAIAVRLYADANNGYLPRRGQGVQPTMQIERPEDWFNALPPILTMKTYAQRVEQGRIPEPEEGSLWSCPSARDVDHKYFFAYAMNMMLSTWWAEEPDRIDNVGPSQTMVFMADGPGTHCSTLPSYESFSPVARHQGRVNLVFLDTHTSSYLSERVGCGVGDPHRSDVRWEVPGSKWPEPGQP